jgi:IS30 family transposase
LAFLRDTNNAASVTAAFKQINTILNEIGEISFGELFTVLLTDNGSEFSDPMEIEKMGHKTHPCNVFYCDPCNSNQKSQIERNHEFIRKILPKGTSFNNLTQEDINLMMSHINSYVRPSYGDMTPLARFGATFGQKLLDALGIKEIPAEEINLTPGLLKERI